MPVPPTATPVPPTPTPVPEDATVQRVKAFHEAISAIEPKEKLDNTLDRIFREHTTVHQLPVSPLIILMHNGLVRYSSMEYDIASESAECAVVRATGELLVSGETKALLDEEYVVVKRGEKWLINFDIQSCD